MSVFSLTLERKPRKCTVCGGRGTWTERVTSTVQGQEYVEIETKRCGTCQGRGVIITAEDKPDWDIGGLNVEENE